MPIKYCDVRFIPRFNRYHHAHILQRWKGIHTRAGQGSYADVTITPDWYAFSGFFYWMVDQPWHGMDVDKDILVPGNRIYGPQYCALVPKYLNGLMVPSNEVYLTAPKLEKVLERYRSEKCFRSDVEASLLKRLDVARLAASTDMTTPNSTPHRS